MKHILFVDDDPLILAGLRRILRSRQVEWEMRFASSGAEALALMGTSPADVVVTDMDMPGMNGAQLLNEIMRLYPKTIRIILSGAANTDKIIQCVEGTHQFLSKPCDGTALHSAINRALELDAWIGNEAIKTFLTQVRTIPSPPELYRKIVHELNSQNGDMGEIGELISQDAAMTAKILQLVNSAFFGVSHRISNPKEAIIYLGLDLIKSLVLAIHVFSESEFDGSIKIHIAMLHQHSLNTAITAKNIALLECQKNEMSNAAFSAGLLHDIGKLVLLSNFSDQYREVLAQSKQNHFPIADSEKAVYGVTHAEVGAYLLGLWGLPMPLVEAAMFHHHPSLSQSQGFTPLTAVHVANVFDQTNLVDLSSALLAQLDHDYLGRVGLLERIPYWWETLLGPADAKK